MHALVLETNRRTFRFGGRQRRSDPVLSAFLLSREGLRDAVRGPDERQGRLPVTDRPARQRACLPADRLANVCALRANRRTARGGR
jgi:hypothetical protein